MNGKTQNLNYHENTKGRKHERFEHFKKISIEAIEREEETHQFEDLSRKIIGASTCHVK
jgi:hypothetical protein